MNSRIVRASGYWNLALALSLIYPPLYRTLGINLTQPVWGWLIAACLGFTAATLILASRDLRIFGGIILWEGVLRFGAAGLLIPAGSFFGYGTLTAVLGLTDLLWGVIFFVIVPRHTGRKIAELLIGRAG